MGSGPIPPTIGPDAVPTAVISPEAEAPFRDDVTATEETPLLRSGSSSSSGTSSSSETFGGEANLAEATDTNHHRNGTKDAAFTHRVGPSRAICIALSLWLLIFLQGTPTARIPGALLLSSIVYAPRMYADTPPK